ncbi:MAG TPA: dihydrofolate reductase family protein [Solirubrobacteraceae bacterium]|nr:dihydrofolate reductase family protein [Solirubrobacteraceae bacterium]
MDTPPERARVPKSADPASLERLLPAGGYQTSAAEVVRELGLWERGARPPGRPRVLLNMIATADGRATLGGRSGPLGGAADHALFHGLRGAVDAVLVGAATVRAERYGRMIADPAQRAARAARGLAPEPLACIVSGRLALEASVPLLREPEARVVIVTASPASLPDTGAHVEYVRSARAGSLDLAAALIELRERFAVERVLCEGGPHLAGQLLAEGLVDELFLTFSPMLAGGEAASGESPRILAGPELQPPAELELLDVVRGDSALLAHYGVLSRVAADGV